MFWWKHNKISVRYKKSQLNSNLKEEEIRFRKPIELELISDKIFFL